MYERCYGECEISISSIHLKTVNTNPQSHSQCTFCAKSDVWFLVLVKFKKHDSDNRIAKSAMRRYVECVPFK